MTDTDCREMLWLVVQCGNPNKAWVCDYEGKKLSALMTLKAARAAARAADQKHNYFADELIKLLEAL